MTATLMSAKQILGDLPTQAEFDRLRKYYPSYDWPHRNVILSGYFQGDKPDELVEKKLAAKGKNSSEMSKQELGGHTKYVVSKVKKALIRLLFLRYTIDDGKTKRQANAALLQRFSSERSKNAGQDAIRKITKSDVYNQEIKQGLRR